MIASYFAKLTLSYQGSQEEKDCAAILFNDNAVNMGDARLNKIAALTYNAGTCNRIFDVLNKSLSAEEHPWKTLLKSLYLLHTIVLFGSELAIDSAIKLCPVVHYLITYNSALVKKSMFGFGGNSGVDYGQPVREEAKLLYAILSSDGNIRSARIAARDGNSWAIPVGNVPVTANKQAPTFAYGQSISAQQTSGMGAGFGLEQVPGMYDSRPERYFDNDNDFRRQPVLTGDHQFTREVSNVCAMGVLPAICSYARDVYRN